MGTIGKRRGAEGATATPPQKRTAPESAHRSLCLLAGKWLKNTRLYVVPTCPYVTVELVTSNCGELADVFGWNYWTSVLIEVKVSRSDFLADAKKPFRMNPEEGMGEHRYYCCPKGLIAPEELPEQWGLLYEDNGKITMEKVAGRQTANHRSEMTVLMSVMRREGIKPKVFNYRIE